MTLDIIIQTYEHANHMSNKANMALPKLPPLPRKGNRTIYLANDELWERAKNLAGKEGLSSVIAKALADFVAQRDADQSSFQKFTFEILGDPHSEDPTEVIAFEGRQLLNTVFALAASPFAGIETSGEADIQIYRTRLGTLVLLAAPSLDQPSSASAFAMYERHDTVRALMSGLVAGCMHTENRHELLSELSKKLGKDAVTWID